MSDAFNIRQWVSPAGRLSYMLQESFRLCQMQAVSGQIHGLTVKNHEEIWEALVGLQALEDVASLALHKTYMKNAKMKGYDGNHVILSNMGTTNSKKTHSYGGKKSKIGIRKTDVNRKVFLMKAWNSTGIQMSNACC
jgi:hypothetical protein